MTGTSKSNDEYWTDIVSGIPGFLEQISALATMALLDELAAQQHQGPVFEIGVYGGKYLSVLARHAIWWHQPIVAADPFFHFTVEQIEARLAGSLSYLSARDDRSSALGVAFRPLRGLSQTLSLDEVQGAGGGQRFAFISIDGSHEYDDVQLDLSLCEPLIAPWGVLAYDDFLNANDVGVNEAFYRFFHSHESPLVPFAYVANKLYLTGHQFAGRYKDVVEKLVQEERDLHTARTYRERVKINRRMVETKLLGRDVLILP